MEIHILKIPPTTPRRDVSLVARRWAEEILCALLDSPIVWATHPGGKPFLASHPRCHFNLSHSGGLICLVIDDEEVGIDIEACRPRNYDALARRFFHPEERAWVDGDIWRFYEVWTAKEAYLKALGIGLRLPLNAFSVIREGKLHSPEGRGMFLPLPTSKIGEAYRGCVFCYRQSPMVFHVEEAKSL